MNYLHLDILLRLIAAHAMADFILQPDSWVKKRMEDKIKSQYLYFHIIITGILTYLAFGSWGTILLPVIITVSHFALDLSKSYIKKDNTAIFLIDQALHLLVIIICWLAYTGQFHTLYNNFIYQYNETQTVLLVTAYLLITIPFSIIIAKLTNKWYTDVYGTNGDDSLKNAGKWIGIIERFLVLTFTIIGQYEAIGFLLAAKSVFRFNELKDSADRKKTEYILIGTFISFAISIALGIAVKMFLKQ